MPRRVLSDDQRRWLLSSALRWTHAVEEVNMRVAFQQREAQEYVTLGPDKVARRRRSMVEPLLLHALRERFGQELGLEVIQRVMRLSAIDLHVLVIALEHIDTSVPRLRQAVEDKAVRDTLKEYTRLWKPVHKVRNALEHEEEYLAVGENPQLADPAWRPPWVGTTRQYSAHVDELVSIEVLGKSYRLCEVIDCCVTRLRLRLADVLSTLSRTEGTADSPNLTGWVTIRPTKDGANPVVIVERRFPSGGKRGTTR